MAHNRLCIYIIHYVQFIILGENPGIWKLWTDYEHYELPEPLMDCVTAIDGKVASACSELGRMTSTQWAGGDFDGF